MSNFHIHCHTDRRQHDCKDRDTVCTIPPLAGDGNEDCVTLCLAQGPTVTQGPQGNPGPLYVDNDGCIALCIDNVSIVANSDPAQNNLLCLSAPGSQPPCVDKSLAYFPDQLTGCLGWNVSHERTLFVATTGDDTTAAPYRMDCLYSTPWAAINAATPGDVVYVFPGTYTSVAATDRVVKDGVKMWCLPGVLIISSTAELFYDDGGAMTSEFRGYADVVLTNNNNRALTFAGNSLIIEGNTFSHTVPFIITNGDLYHYTVEEDRTVSTSQLLLVRLPVNTDMDLKYHVDLAVSDNDTVSQFDLANFGDNGNIDVWVGKFELSDSSNDGVVFLNTNTCHQKVYIDALVQTGIPLGGTNRPILGFNFPGGELDISIRDISNNSDDMGFRGNSIISRGPSTTPTTGTIYMQGTLNINVNNAAPDPTNNLSGFETTSRIILNLQMIVNGDPAIGRAFIDATNGPDRIFISGRVRYTGSGALTENAFNIDVSGPPTSTPTFRDLVVTTDQAAGPITSPGAGVPILLKLIKVFSNTALSGAYSDALTAAGGGYNFNGTIVT